ncbi:MAG: hypothetical protein GF310_06715 [candidate division Zixibacteria bacterium]|nr:hypothetical protein [candidate division Zixibacteria bacterium]
MKGMRFLIYALLLIVAFLLLSCDDDPEGPANLPPEKPYNPQPANLADGISLTGFALQWQCSDPDDDPLSYEVYFGAEVNPPLVESGYTQTIYYPQLVEGESVYYWWIAASDDKGNRTVSPIWSFTTVNAREFMYPMAVGYRWEYQHTQTFTNFDPPEIEPQVPDVFDAYSTVEINDVIEAEGDSRYQFHQKVEQGMEVFEQNSVYANSSFGLMYYGTDNPGAGVGDTPAPIRNPIRLRFNGKEHGSANELLREFNQGAIGCLAKSADYYEEPLTVLLYPLNLGSHWPYRDKPQDIFHIEKKVIGWETVDVPAGSFECYVVEWLYDKDFNDNYDEDLQVLDYISAAGLVKRVVNIRNIQVVSYSHPNGIGTMDMIETLELTDYSLTPDV